MSRSLPRSAGALVSTLMRRLLTGYRRTKVCALFGVEPDEIYSKSRQKTRAEARGLFCYWAVVELGYSLANLARLFGMTGQGIGYAVRRGERTAKEFSYGLTD